MSFSSTFKSGIAIVSVFVLVMLLAGCVTNTLAENVDNGAVVDNEGVERFGHYVVITDEMINDHVVITMYDPDTYIMYRYTKSVSYESFTELWNADGTLQIYHEAMSAAH